MSDFEKLYSVSMALWFNDAMASAKKSKNASELSDISENSGQEGLGQVEGGGDADTLGKDGKSVANGETSSTIESDIVGSSLSASVYAHLWRIEKGRGSTDNFIDIYVCLRRECVGDPEGGWPQSVHVYIPNGRGDEKDRATFIDPEWINQRILHLVIGAQPEGTRGNLGTESVENRGYVYPSSVLLSGDEGAVTNIFMPKMDTFESAGISDFNHVQSGIEKRAKDGINYEKKYSGVLVNVPFDADFLKIINSGYGGRPEYCSMVVFGVRVALPPGTENPFMHFYSPIDRAFLSGFEEIDFIDFRMNDNSSLPDEIIRKMSASVVADESTAITRIPVGLHLNYFCNILYRLDHSSPSPRASRLLERRYWEGYVQGEVDVSAVNDRTFVYTWEEVDGSVTDADGRCCNSGSKQQQKLTTKRRRHIKKISARLSVRRSNKNTVTKYIIMFTLTSAIASCQGTLLWEGYKDMRPGFLRPEIQSEQLSGNGVGRTPIPLESVSTPQSAEVLPPGDNNVASGSVSNEPIWVKKVLEGFRYSLLAVSDFSGAAAMIFAAPFFVMVGMSLLLGMVFQQIMEWRKWRAFFGRPFLFVWGVILRALARLYKAIKAQ